MCATADAASRAGNEVIYRHQPSSHLHRVKYTLRFRVAIDTKMQFYAEIERLVSI